MHDAVAEELRLPKARNQPEDAALLRPGEVCLEADEVVGGVGGVLGPELDGGPGAPAGPGVGEAHGLQRAEAEGLVSRSSDLLHGLAGAEEVGLLELAGDDALGGEKRLKEGVVLFLIHGAVEVVSRPGLLIAGLFEDHLAVERISVDDGCGGVKERHGVRSHGRGDRLEERVGAEGAGRDNAGSLGNLPHLLADHLDERLALHEAGHLGRELIAVDGKRPSGGHARLPGNVQEHAPHLGELGLEEAGSRLRLGGLQRVGAHELGKAVGVVGGRVRGRPLLEEADAHAPPRQLKGALGACEARPNDRNEPLHAAPPSPARAG